jgi:hypothetical protein
MPPLEIEGQTEEMRLKEFAKNRNMRLASIIGLTVFTITFGVALFTRPLPLC